MPFHPITFSRFAGRLGKTMRLCNIGSVLAGHTGKRVYRFRYLRNGLQPPPLPPLINVTGTGNRIDRARAAIMGREGPVTPGVIRFGEYEQNLRREIDDVQTVLNTAFRTLGSRSYSDKTIGRKADQFLADGHRPPRNNNLSNDHKMPIFSSYVLLASAKKYLLSAGLSSGLKGWLHVQGAVMALIQASDSFLSLERFVSMAVVNEMAANILSHDIATHEGDESYSQTRRFIDLNSPEDYADLLRNSAAMGWSAVLQRQDDALSNSYFDILYRGLLLATQVNTRVPLLESSVLRNQLLHKIKDEFGDRMRIAMLLALHAKERAKILIRADTDAWKKITENMDAAMHLYPQIGTGKPDVPKKLALLLSSASTIAHEE